MDSFVPKYAIITEYIKNKIKEGALKDGSKAPSENALTKKFGVSRDTVRRAFKNLEEEGILTSIRGSGTYVHVKKSSASKRVAVITTYVENYIFPRIIMGIESALADKGYSMQLSFTNNKFDKEREVLSDLIEKEDVAGIIMEPVKSALPNPNLDCYKVLKEKGIPVIFINTYYKGIDIPHVSLDDSRMGYMATRYLLAKGHKKVGAILKMDDGQGHLRLSGYSKALLDAGIKNTSDNIVWYDTKDENDISVLSEHLLNRLKGCSAVFCYNDRVALEYISFLSKQGIKVPDDISIISMDNSDLAEYGDVKITSLRHPMESLGKKAANSLFNLMEDPKKDVTEELITTVVERDSVKTLKE
ncbi:MAG: GntR family transcriptional regulator [Lachnospiraceae bacterium]|nr:GntR family transcriptional regulator [Lachnospiraceae bacterium]